MYRIKQVPEDFVVKESVDYVLKESGRYGILKLWKRFITTQAAVKHIARLGNLKEHRVGYAGLKDKEAICEQHVSVPSRAVSRLDGYETEFIKTELLGFRDDPLSLGDLTGNRFIITVRALTEEETGVMQSNLNRVRKGVINYFDEQRFGADNMEIGLAILKKDFAKAARLLAETNDDVALALKINPSDRVGAIRKLPRRVRMLYVSAFQSSLFNGEAIRIAKNSGRCRSAGKLFFPNEEVAQTRIALPGFHYGDDKQLSGFGLTKRSFVIREMPDISSEGAERDLIVVPQELSVSDVEPDELNKGKKKMRMCFMLPKGSYATMIVKALFAH